jgi:hypothetical protein
MLAYKFLARGAIAPFTGRSWPIPGPRAPGAWIAARPGDLARYGVHACRLDDLSYWPDDELWLAELGGVILEEPHQLVASRGRLVQRVARWGATTAREYAVACAWRARDLAAEALGRAGLDAEEAALRSCLELAALELCAATIAGDARRGDPRALAAYAAGAAMRARQGRYPEGSLQCAHLGAAMAGGEAGEEQERAWQSRWLAHRLELREVAARSGVAELEA